MGMVGDTRMLLDPVVKLSFDGGKHNPDGSPTKTVEYTDGDGGGQPFICSLRTYDGRNCHISCNNRIVLYPRPY